MFTKVFELLSSVIKVVIMDDIYITVPHYKEIYAYAELQNICTSAGSLHFEMYKGWLYYSYILRLPAEILLKIKAE